MDEDCPSCLEKGIRSSVTFWQITLDSAILACSNLNCSFPFDREYRDVIWKRNYRDINKERNPKVKLADVILKDVKPIDDYFNCLELPDIANETVETSVANETVETADTNAVGSSSLSVDFSTLLALSEDDAQPLVVDDERNPDNPVSESHHCISNSSYTMDNSPYIMGDLSFLEIDSKKPAEVRTTKGSAVEDAHSGNESDSSIPVIEIESEDEEERHEKWWRAMGDKAFGGNSLRAVNENSQSEIEGNPSSGRDQSFEVEKNLLVDSDNNNVTGKNPVSVDGVKTYIVICKDVVPTFDVDQLKRNGISVQILNPNSNLKTVDKDEPEMSSVKEIIGSDYSSSGHISSEPGRPYSVVEDKVRIWLGDNLGSEGEMVITPAHLFHYIVQNFVSKPENGEVRTAAVDSKVEEVSPMSSEKIGIISENLSVVTMDDARNFDASAAFETDSVPSKELAGTVSRDEAEPWSKKASERFSKLKSLTTAVSSDSSTKPIPHSNLPTRSENSVNDGEAFLTPAVADSTEESYAPFVTKRRCTWRNTDSNATTSDSTKDTSSDNPTSDELNEGFLLKEPFSFRSPIRRSVMKFGSLFKTSPTVRQARLIKYKANRFRRQSKIAHWRKPVISPDTTPESSDVASSPNNKSVTLSEPSSPTVKQFDIIKTKIAQLTEICTQSLESIHLGNGSASTHSSSVVEESPSGSAAECVTPSVSASRNKSPSPTKNVLSTKTPSPIRSKCRIPQVIKSVISSSDTTVTVLSKEELVIRNEGPFTPCEAKFSTSPAVKSTSPIIDNSTSTSDCILLNKQTQPAHVTNSVHLGRSHESARKELDNIYMTDTLTPHAVTVSPTVKSIVEEHYSQRSKRIHLRRSLKSSTQPAFVKSLVKDSIDKEVNCEKLSTSNNTEELSETIETTSEKCVCDLVVRRQSPSRSEVPQLKGPLKSSPDESTNSVKSDKPSDVQETVPPLTELYVTQSVTSPVKKSAATAAKQSPRLKSYRSRKSFTPPSAKSTRIRKSVESSIKSKVTRLRKTRIVHLGKRTSKSPISANVQPPKVTRKSLLSPISANVQSPKVTRKSLLSSATDDLDKSQLSSSKSNVEMKPDRNVTRRLAISDSSSVKFRVHDSALKRSPRSVLSATPSQSSRLQRTTGIASRKTVAPARNMALDLGTASASAEQPVKHTRSSSIVTKESVSHSLHTKPVTLSNTATKRRSLTKLSTPDKLKSLRTTRRSTERSCWLNTSLCAETKSLGEAVSPRKRKETEKCCRPTRSVTREETSTTRRSNSVIAVRECKKSAANSTASSVSKSCREAAEIKPDSSAANSTASSVSKSEAAKIKPDSSAANSTASSVSKSWREAAKIKPDSSAANSTASGVSKSCREAAEIRPDALPQTASVITEASPARKSYRQKHLLQGSLASSSTKTLSSTRLLESNLRQNLKCSNVSVVIVKSPAANAALLKLRKATARASGIPPVTQSREKHLGIHRMNPVKVAAAPLSCRAYVKLHRISLREDFNLRHISKIMKEKDSFKAEGNCRTVFPSKSQKSDSDLQQIVPPSEPNILELRKKDSIEKENLASSRKRRKYSVDVTYKPRGRTVEKVSSSEENVFRIPSSVALKSQSEQLTAKSRVLLTRVSETSLSNKNLSKQVNSLCTKGGVVSREDVNTRRLVKEVAHQSRTISSVKERHNVQPKLEATHSGYMFRGLVSQKRSPRRCHLQRAKGTPERCSARARSCKK